jgi:hypothetical protein
LPFELNKNIVKKIRGIDNQIIRDFLSELLNYQVEKNLYDNRNPRYSAEIQKIIEKYYRNYKPTGDKKI